MAACRRFPVVIVLNFVAQLWPFTTVKTTKKTKYYTHEEALTLILASSEDSEDSQYDSEREEMFKQQLDDVLDR